jgi:hypothetical protein
VQGKKGRKNKTENNFLLIHFLLFTFVVMVPAITILYLLFFAVPAALPTDTVLVCHNQPVAYAYHNSLCRGLEQCEHNLDTIAINQAIDMKYVPCKICYKP